MRLLGCLEPDLQPRATQHIGAMIATIQRIIEHGHGYAVDGDVFFDVASMPDYGRLSGRNQARSTSSPAVASLTSKPAQRCSKQTSQVLYSMRQDVGIILADVRGRCVQASGQWQLRRSCSPD